MLVSYTLVCWLDRFLLAELNVFDCCLEVIRFVRAGNGKAIADFEQVYTALRISRGDVLACWTREHVARERELLRSLRKNGSI